MNGIQDGQFEYQIHEIKSLSDCKTLHGSSEFYNSFIYNKHIYFVFHGDDCNINCRNMHLCYNVIYQECVLACI